MSGLAQPFAALHARLARGPDPEAVLAEAHRASALPNGDAEHAQWAAFLLRNANVFARGTAQTLVQYALREGEGSPVARAASGFEVPALRQLPRALQGLRNARVRTYEGPFERISGLAVSPNGKYVVTSGNAGALRLLELATGEVTLRYPTGKDESYRVALSPAGARVLTLTVKGNLLCFDAATAALLWKVKACVKQGVLAVASDGRVVTAQGGNVRVWELETGKALAKYSLKGVSFSVWGMALTPDHRLLSWWGDELVSVHLDTGRFEPAVPCPPSKGESHTAYAASLDGRYAAALTNAGTLHVIERSTGRIEVTPPPPRRERGHEGTRSFLGLRGLVALPDGGFASVGADGALTLYRDGRCDEVVEFEGDLDGLVAHVPGTSRALAAEGSRLHLLDLSVTSEPGRTRERHPSDVREVALHPDGKRFVTSSRDARLRFWDAATLEPLGAVECPSFSPVWALHPDGKRLVHGFAPDAVYVLDLATGAKLHRLEGHTGFLQAAYLSRDGERGYTLCSDGHLRAWSLATGERLANVAFCRANSHPVVALHPDGRTLVTAGGAGFVAVDLEGDLALAERKGGRARQLLFARGGEWVVVVDNSAVKILDFATGRLVHQLALPSGEPDVLTVAPQGEFVVLAAGKPRALSVWEPATGAVTKLPYNARWGHAVALPGTTRVAIASAEPQLTVWDVAAKAPVGMLVLERWLSFVTATSAHRLVGVDTAGNLLGLAVR